MTELKQKLQDAGILGAGGAGFPSYAKLADGADTLVINGAECEPLLYTDYVLMREHLDDIVYGAEQVMDACGMKQTILGVKRHTALALSMTDGEMLSARVKVHLLPDVYPMGDEIILIYECTGRLVRPGCLPITEGVIVYNVETVMNIAAALRDGTPVIDKYVTIGGDVAQPKVVCVPVGTPVRDVLAQTGVTVPDDHVVLDGGPSMGRIISHESDYVTLTTKGLLVLPEDIPAVMSKRRSYADHLTVAASTCCGCSRCTDLCPRALLGYPLEPHKMVAGSVKMAELAPELVLTATLCCGCGVCELSACCQGISPKHMIDEYKKILGQKRMRFSPDPAVTYRPHEQRGARELPTSRWMSLLGVSKYDKRAVFSDEEIVSRKVGISLGGHIGAPAVPVVSVGQYVRRGEKIAEAGNGLSLPKYASVDGTVCAIKENRIDIERDKR